MTRAYQFGLAALMVLALSACASNVVPQTNKERVIVADQHFTVAVNAASDLRDQGVISDRQWSVILPAIDRGDQALDAAYAALDTDTPGNALGYLRLVNSALTEINRRTHSDG